MQASLDGEEISAKKGDTAAIIAGAEAWARKAMEADRKVPALKTLQVRSITCM
jgi:hypothetical protein